MRILMGQWKGRSFPSVTDKRQTRPTTAYAKEGIMNVLLHNYGIERARVLDLFAGTGSVSFEFLSLGASHVRLIEKSRFLCQRVKEISTALPVTKNSLDILPISIARFFSQFARRATYDIIFADPPFNFPRKTEILFQVIEHKLLSSSASVFICEHAREEDSFQRISFPSRLYSYGDVGFSIFRGKDLL